MKYLLNEETLNKRAQLIPLLEASNKAANAVDISYYNYRSASSPELPSTTHLSIVDKYGNIVSMTSSIETAFGSQHMVAGFLLNNQLTDFSFTFKDENNKPVANRIQPGKRPRSSMAPMIIFNESLQPILIIGSPGGARIIPYVAKTIAQHLFFGASLEEAISSPQVVNLNKSTDIEGNLDDSKRLFDSLYKLGHEVKFGDQTSGIHAIRIRPSGYEGVADPRREGTARTNQ